MTSFRVSYFTSAGKNCFLATHFKAITMSGGRETTETWRPEGLLVPLLQERTIWKCLGLCFFLILFSSSLSCPNFWKRKLNGPCWWLGWVQKQSMVLPPSLQTSDLINMICCGGEVTKYCLESESDFLITFGPSLLLEAIVQENFGLLTWNDSSEKH